MLRRFSTNFSVFSMIMDILTVVFSLWAMERLRPLLSPLAFIKDLPSPLRTPFTLYLAFPILWVLIMAVLSVYDGHKNLRIVDEYTSLTLGAVFAGITLAGFLYLTYRDTSRALFILFIIVTYILLLTWRALIRILYRARNFSMNLNQHIVILGAGLVGRGVESRIDEHKHLGVIMEGFLDDDPAKRSSQSDILGSLDEIRMIIKEKRITDVVIALPTRAYERVNSLVSELQDLAVQIWIVPDYFNLALHQAKIEDFLGLPMLDLRAPALIENQRLIKRVFDLFIVALFSIPVLLFMILVSLAIVLDDGFPILFKQQRVGENGRLFSMYKFRTMVRDAERLRTLVEQTDEQGNLIHKRRDDPRITKVGQILRRFSLDELPQFFNVLRGHMSLVGPRPELPYLVEKYQPWQRKRFAVPQGMTGWWQIHGRSDKPMHLHTEDDLYYVQNYSIWLDIQILIRTIWIVLRGRGAY
ncbi:MAG: sugar transferase [Chloroflexi bacterium]|nr:sugar transferase [Chloroflexota bacterium]